jgi:purine operon repressor
MTVATGVALVAREPERKKVSDYLPILIIEEIDEENGIIRISANPEIFL